MTEPLSDDLRTRIEALVGSHRVVLFMKGTRGAPRCGFSGRVVGLLDAHLDDYATVDILADGELREGLKAWSNWPTFPQLFVDGELVGGADIVEELHERGELAPALGAAAEAAGPLGVAVTITDAARDRIREVLDGEDAPLRLRVDADFDYRFEAVDEVGRADATVVANGITLVLDRQSAARADGLSIDFVSGPSGSGLVVDNPNEPAKVRSLDVAELQRWLAAGVPLQLVDVRTDEEWAIARIEGARLLDEPTAAWLMSLPRDTRLVFQCHHGVRSRHAAEHFLAAGFREVFNLEGGIDAWSRRVDPEVPRY